MRACTETSDHYTLSRGMFNLILIQPIFKYNVRAESSAHIFMRITFPQLSQPSWYTAVDKQLLKAFVHLLQWHVIS